MVPINQVAVNELQRACRFAGGASIRRALQNACAISELFQTKVRTSAPRLAAIWARIVTEAARLGEGGRVLLTKKPPDAAIGFPSLVHTSWREVENQQGTAHRVRHLAIAHFGLSETRQLLPRRLQVRWEKLLRAFHSTVSLASRDGNDANSIQTIRFAGFFMLAVVESVSGA